MENKVMIYDNNLSIGLDVPEEDKKEIKKVNEANEELVKALKELTKLQNSDENSDENINVNDIMRNILEAQENIINHWLEKKEIDNTLLQTHADVTNAEIVLSEKIKKFSTGKKNNSLFSLFGGTQKSSKQRYTINQF
jgi:hypothetical protein